ncbi:20S cyclosome subunit [Rasamsonia emersonii CBS 393.64]|uniref:20S cyclosome subunit n=1 Tax=Rasamsonia emersonii (strain ATCC 16479 / CBS 393.64 / IMI 116815) TaxID=1408163 RepID=A0A0F4Z455_RASE3|nr:20S cyclosome subunit [Rasamsonia emersonii CBS 393.64]KKA24648.1 20S cyclosome subunit [Rasamsonia emersonii CBS 393.64]
MAVTFTEENIKELRFHLEDAAVKCSERCLYQAAEMLDALVPIDGSDTDPDSPMDMAEPPPPPVNPFLRQQDPVEAALEAQEAHKYLLAKSYFDTREYDRCAAVFLPPTIPPAPLSSVSPNAKSRTSLTPQKGPNKGSQFAGSKGNSTSKNPYPRLSQKSLFLALYAKYLAGEKRKEEETEMVLGPADGGMTVNRELPDLARGLEGYFAERREQGLEDRSQGWLEYLYGIILLKGKNEEEAKKWLIRSVHLYPYNWGAWQELNDLLSNVEDVRPFLPVIPLLFLSTDSILDFEEASSIFAEILISNPHRLDSLDHYSNILYVMGARPQLAFIAQLATATDKFRPETCCVVGNYYSLKSEHEKAVMYFRRALTLDRNFLSAWTLMGHEYIEMKNTHAAIESYRRAVDVNRKDYRAWYGLGQAYEVLDMSFYALFYYQRAAALRPYDPKMWQAVGSCYAKMGRLEQSIKALKRALVAGSYYESGSGVDAGGASQSGVGAGGAGPGRKILDPETLYQIATLYERLGDEDEAAAYMELTLQQETGEIDRPEPDSDDDNNVNNNDRPPSDDDTTEGGGDHRRRHRQQQYENDETEAVGGTGVTATTSKARLWLARWALRHGDLARADQLAGELCQDGIEVEEAKALMRDVRARREGGG